MTKTEIARKYRQEYGIEMPTLKLARIMYGKENLTFKNVEECRTFLRAIEGKAWGVKPPNVLKVEERPKNPYNLPESYQEKREPLQLPLTCNNILLISDLHIPYHDIDAITIALEYGVEHKVNTIVINGDMLDFCRISRFETDFSKRSVKQEFDSAKHFLRALRQIFPSAEIYWIKGNHDQRYEKYLFQKASEIWDDPYFRLEERLRLNEERVHLIDDKILVKAGKLAITHGHHIFKGIFTPVSPARGAYMKAKQSVIVGHLHRSSHHVESDMEGNLNAAWSTGCMCQLKMDYSPLISNSQHGFAHVTVEKNGDFTVKNFSIIKGKLH
jgi:predicted phosphodiesterase